MRSLLRVGACAACIPFLLSSGTMAALPDDDNDAVATQTEVTAKPLMFERGGQGAAGVGLTKHHTWSARDSVAPVRSSLPERGAGNSTWVTSLIGRPRS